MSKKKNILLIFTDQQRYDTIEALGNGIIKTPALNSLVENGTSFTRAYTPSPVCVSARYAMHTGQMPHKTNCVANETMPDNRKSFMQILSKNTYQTHGVGKMHFTFKDRGAENMWGFESRELSEEHGVRYDYEKFLEANGYEYVYDVHGVRSELYYIPQPSQLPEKLHNTTWVVNRSINFLKTRDQERPFFLMTSFIKPHPPFESPTPWNKLYRGPEMPLPKRPQDSENLITYWNRFQNRYKYRDQGIDDNLVRCIKTAYYNAISFIDYNLGRLFDYMMEKGLFENTLIVFTSDHGEMMGDYNCFGKRCFFDSVARIPMIMVHPDMDKNVICTRPVSLIDLLPTFLEYAGIEQKEDYSGVSLVDIVRGKSERDMVFSQFENGGYGMYMAAGERFKYVYSAPDQKEWLFDHKANPRETRNIANNPMFIHVTEMFRKKLIDYFKKDGYIEPFEDEEWKCYTVRKVPEDLDQCLLFQDPEKSIPKIPGYEREFRFKHDSLFEGVSMNIKI